MGNAFISLFMLYQKKKMFAASSLQYNLLRLLDFNMIVTTVWLCISANWKINVIGLDNQLYFAFVVGYLESNVCRLRRKCHIEHFFQLWLKPSNYLSSTILICTVYSLLHFFFCFHFQTVMGGVYHESDCYNVMLDYIFIHLSELCSYMKF